ncbi:imidazole glycerol phosphate synthase subunit HisH [Parvularcula sp. LCG005]|uniref:imidazole glycerol phosphate synthase subunit HisH n=1 Tax=Parvularcula sp. LCG005 TaxID=3078805 RepID=UPI002942B866|nr:imidazole glycerol phosphate synthase subunit HisH [Parvularcula sp. LCG005]WOI53543.1 imidazole glycerol phosphate synthase subunit HisH [Parvularcula sp. LCG005]
MTQSVCLIDYGSGNLHSAHKALVKAAHDHDIHAEVHVTADPALITAADRIVLPGVGAFGACMEMLEARPGLREALEEAVQGAGRPFLGICVGMQLLARTGLEHGETAGLGWINGQVRALTAPGLKIPHMGWNTVQGRGHAILPEDADAYFVHSYCFDADDPASVQATCGHGEDFAAMIGRDNIVGVQFHPEKSQAYGLTLLANFMKWRP